MTKLVYHVATTLDNFIAHTDGSIEGFLPEGEHIPAYLEHLKGYSTVVMGKATYEFGYQFGMKPGDAPYPHMQHYIFSNSLKLPTDSHPNVHVVNEEPASFVADLKEKAETDIYLCGGAKLPGYLFDRGCIDRIIIKLNPVLFGKGIPLFEGKERITNLQLVDTCVYNSGVVLLTYDIVR
ncbi:MAG TPA: dihydrofolate reductase family protein [Ohtaekwangia sp.]|nr:dihydrofolate reductase family protein [Ohtaekwangia sp.]